MNCKLFVIFLFIILYQNNNYAQYETFRNSYDILTTIAGKGDIDEKGVNGWSEVYEGGNAIEAELSRPHIAIADIQGNIYIADKDAHAVRKVSPDGEITTVAGTSIAGDNGDGVAPECQLNYPNGLWVKSDGTLYILDLGNNKIRKVDTLGNMITVIEDTNGISLGRGLWVTPDEDTIYYACGSKIKVWTETGGIATFADGFSSLGNIMIDPLGFLVVTDRGVNQVFRLSKDGSSREAIAGNGSTDAGKDGIFALECAINGVRGIWFISDGSYLLATHEGSQIWYVDISGIIHLFLDGSEGDENHTGDGENYQIPGYKISEARAVSVDYNGNIIITENDRGFIRKIALKETTNNIDAGHKQIDNTINIFPNPASNKLYIRYDIGLPGKVHISFYNENGQPVHSSIHNYKEVGSSWHQVSIDNLSSGNYTICFQTDQLFLSKKLVILK